MVIEICFSGGVVCGAENDDMIYFAVALSQARTGLELLQVLQLAAEIFFLENLSSKIPQRTTYLQLIDVFSFTKLDRVLYIARVS